MADAAPSPRRLAIAYLAFALVVIAFHAPVLTYPPIALDDYGSLEALREAPLGALLARDRFGHFRPAKTAMFWLAARAGDEQIWVVRALVLLALLAAALLAARSLGRRVHSPWLGLAAALSWSLHPSTATATAWLSAGNLVFASLGVLSYLESARRTLRALSPNAWALAASVSLAFGAANHELAILAPLLLLFDPQRPEQPLHRRPLIVASALTCVAYTFLYFAAEGALPVYRFAAEPRLRLLLHAPRYLFANLALWVWPFGQFSVLGRDDPSEHTAAMAIGWVALPLLALAVAWLFRRASALAYGLVWALLFIAPVSNFIPLGNTPIAVHYGFLAGIGLALALVATLSLLSRGGWASPRVFGVALAAAWTVASAVESRHVLAAWSNEEALYRTTLANDAANLEAIANLSSLYLRQRRYDRARALLEAAPQSAHKDPIVLINALDLWLATGQPERVLAALAARGVSSPSELLMREGRARKQLGRHALAAESFRRAYLAASPSVDTELRFQAGFQALIAHLEAGQGEAAAELLAQLTERYPDREELRIARELLRSPGY